MGDNLDAWAETCDRLAALGRRLGDDDFPSDEADRADGVAHVVEQALCWFGWSVFHADPRRPTFERQNDLITQWGGPNADNVYRHARVEPGRRYRIRGHMHSCEEFILAVRAGFMHLPTWGTLFEITASELGITEGTEFDFLVGDGTDVPLPPGALSVSIREYYWDWVEDEPATFTIECLDPPGADRFVVGDGIEQDVIYDFKLKQGDMLIIQGNMNGTGIGGRSAGNDAGASDGCAQRPRNRTPRPIDAPRERQSIQPTVIGHDAADDFRASMNPSMSGTRSVS